MGVSKKRQEEVNYYLSKENLEKYLPSYSANYIATKLFLPNFTSTAGTVIDRAKMFGIKTHSVSESCFLEHVKKSKKETLIDLYGVENASQAQEIKDKKEAAAIEKYGCINVFQAKEIKEKSKATNLEKYGTEYVSRLTKFKTHGKRSKLHQAIEKILEKNNIQYESEKSNLFLKYNEYYKRDYSPIVDIILEDLKLVIEINGNVWHANPEKYKPDDLICLFKGKVPAKEIWYRDKLRIEQIESFGYTVLIIWESEYNSNKQKTEEKILNAISKIKINQKN